MREKDELYMQEAIKMAQKAANLGEIPVGAVIVCDDRIIARAHNMTERLNDATAHAEMQAFTAASEIIGGKYLQQCTLYVTLEPCPMCCGAAYWTQIGRIVYGATDERKIISENIAKLYHPKTVIEGNILEAECSKLLKDFFLNRR